MALIHYEEVLCQVYGPLPLATSFASVWLLPLACGVAHPLKTWLRPLDSGWATSLCAVTSTVCAQHCSSSGFSTSLLWPQTLSLLFTGSVYLEGSTSELQSWHFKCCMVLLHHIWISWFADLPSLPPYSIVIIIPATRSDILSCNRWLSFISGCYISPLELITARCLVLGFSVCFSSSTKYISVLQIISWLTTLNNLFRRLHFHELHNNICYFSHVNSFWLTSTLLLIWLELCTSYCSTCHHHFHCP